MGLDGSFVDLKRMRHRFARFEADFVEEQIDWTERGAVSTKVRD